MHLLGRACVIGALFALSISVGRADDGDMKICLTGWATRAVEACSRLIQSGQLTGSDLAAAYSSRANSEVGYTHHYKQAIADLSEAIRLEPGNADFFSSRAGAYLANNDYDRAIADYSEEVRLHPDSVSALTDRGLAYCTIKNYDLAIADYDKAIRLDPNNGPAFYDRAMAKRAKGDGADADISKSKEIDPGIAAAAEEITISAPVAPTVPK